MHKKFFPVIVLFALSCSAPETQEQEAHQQAQTIDVSQREIKVVSTARNGDQRLSAAGTLRFDPLPQPLETDVVVFIDPTKTFQEMVGIGGAITDASAEVFDKLSEAKKKEILRAYYDREEGIGYSLSRTNINSCDFSSASYTYVADGDSTLSSFDIAPDKQFKIPLIKQAIAAAGDKLPLLVSPWSPPAWMKTNGNMLQGGALLPRYRQAWANYYIKFIQAYEQLDIPVWGLTVQNEPMATQTWESCLYTAEEERDFIKQYLGPTLHKAGMRDKKLIAWDHNRDLLYQRASTVLNDPEAAQYVWGIGYHWYETWTGAGNNFDNMHRVKEAFPDKELIFTEGCVEKFDLKEVNSWRLGEHYGKNMIHDFNAGTAAWCDWNILLDEKGGPNHVGNFCFAPVHADLRSGELIYTSAYYYIGHFSKYVRPGAKRIISSASQDRLLSTAFINTDGQIVVIVMNSTDSNIPYKLWIGGKAAAIDAAAHSISTILIG